jgi:hypothetical protein
MRGLESRSLGATEFRRQLLALRLGVASEYEREARSHYFDVFKAAPTDKLQTGGFAEAQVHAL